MTHADQAEPAAERRDDELNEVIHAPNRLRICAFLEPIDRAEFSVVRDMLGVSDSVTSKHVRVLQEAGFLDVEKPVGLGRVKTWLRLTASGRAAYRAHVRFLRALIADAL